VALLTGFVVLFVRAAPHSGWFGTVRRFFSCRRSRYVLVALFASTDVIFVGSFGDWILGQRTTPF